jgi:hypothetical protein
MKRANLFSAAAALLIVCGAAAQAEVMTPELKALVGARWRHGLLAT